jgi:hypothetical protein
MTASPQFGHDAAAIADDTIAIEMTTGMRSRDGSCSRKRHRTTISHHSPEIAYLK